MSEGIYKFAVTPRTRAGYLGVYVDINSRIFNVCKDNVPTSMSQHKEWEIEIDNLEREILKMSNGDIRRFIQSKLSIKKFKL